VRESIHPQGTRVRVRPGRFPMARDLVGREGVVLHLDPYQPARYGVQLDGESRTRQFTEDELEKTG
jgi:hypothetical protein